MDPFTWGLIGIGGIAVSKWWKRRKLTEQLENEEITKDEYEAIVKHYEKEGKI